MTARGYHNRFSVLDSEWTSTKPTKPETYDPNIKTSIAEVIKEHNEALLELRQDEHEVYLAIEEVWKEKILEAYDR